MKPIKRVWARKTKAHKKYGRQRQVPRSELDPLDRKQTVSYSLPLWQVLWVDEMARSKGMHKSTFMAGLVESSKAGLDAADEEMNRASEQGEELEVDE